MSFIHRWLFPAVTAFALAAPVSAQWKPLPGADQSVAVSTVSLAAPAPDRGPMSLREAVLEPAAPVFVAPVFPGQARESENVAFMIVGGAALVVGSLIDGDAGTLMMVGGGVVGLIGLFRYLR